MAKRKYAFQVDRNLYEALFIIKSLAQIDTQGEIDSALKNDNNTYSRILQRFQVAAEKRSTMGTVKNVKLTKDEVKIFARHIAERVGVHQRAIRRCNEAIVTIGNADSHQMVQVQKKALMQKVRAGNYIGTTSSGQSWLDALTKPAAGEIFAAAPPTLSESAQKAIDIHQKQRGYAQWEMDTMWHLARKLFGTRAEQIISSYETMGKGRVAKDSLREIVGKTAFNTLVEQSLERDESEIPL